MQNLETTKQNIFLAKEILFSIVKHIAENIFYYLPCLIFYFITASFWQLGILSVLEKGSSLSDSGLLMGHFMLVSGLLILPLSFLSDRLSRRLVVFSGFGCICTSGIFRILPINIGSDLSFLLLGLGLGCLGAPIKIFTRELIKKNVDNNLNDSDIYLAIEFCSRLMILASSHISWRLLKNGADLPWIIWSLLAAVACISLTKYSKTTIQYSDSTGTNQNQNSVKPNYIIRLKICVIHLSTVFIGIEIGIRSIILNPYITEVLNHGNIASLQLQGTVQAVAGITGTFFFKFINRKFFNDYQDNDILKERLYIVFIILALLTYSVLNYVSSITDQYSVFLRFSAIAIISMGWFFPLRDSLISLYSSGKNDTLLLGSVFSIQYIAAALTLYTLKYSGISVGEIREYWFFASTMLIASSLILIFIPTISIFSLGDVLKSNKATKVI